MAGGGALRPILPVTAEGSGFFGEVRITKTKMGMGKKGTILNEGRYCLCFFVGLCPQLRFRRVFGRFNPRQTVATPWSGAQDS